MPNLKYAQREVELAKSYLANREDDMQKDRLAWWSAYLGDFETANQYAVSQKVKDYINERQSSLQL